MSNVHLHVNMRSCTSWLSLCISLCLCPVVATQNDVDGLRKRVESFDVCDVQMKSELAEKSDLIEELQKHKNKSVADMEQYRDEIRIKQSLIDELTHKLEESTARLNSLHAKNNDLTSDLEQVKSEWTAEKKKLESGLEALDNEHQTAVAQLVEKREKLTTENKELKHQIQLLEAKLSESGSAKKLDDFGEKHLDQNDGRESANDLSRTVATQAAEVARLSEVARVQALEVTHLREECESLESDLKSRCEALDRQHRLLEAQQHELERLRGTLSQQEQACKEQVNLVVAEVEMLRSKESAVRQSLEESHSANNALRRQVGELQSRQTQLEKELKCLVNERDAATTEIAQLKLKIGDDKIVTSSQLGSPEGEDFSRKLASLQLENETLKQSCEDIESVSKLYESEVERLTKVNEQQINEMEKLNEELGKLRHELSSYQSSINHVKAADDRCAESASNEEILSLQTTVANKETQIEDLKLKNTKLEEKIGELNGEIKSLKKLLTEQTAATDALRKVQVKEAALNESSIVMNGTTESATENEESDAAGERMHAANSNNSIELSRLHSTIAHQKDLIDTLNSKYTSLLSLLDDRSRSAHGSSVLVDMHQLESEARELRADRERLVAVLGEKTRECSTLRNEVHRLTAAAAATQAALAKTQQEAKHLAQGAANSREEVNQDMKSEAVKRLSQMIRDKDVELEALKLKNATLVQVSGVDFRVWIQFIRITPPL